MLSTLTHITGLRSSPTDTVLPKDLLIKPKKLPFDQLTNTMGLPDCITGHEKSMPQGLGAKAKSSGVKWGDIARRTKQRKELWSNDDSSMK